MSYRFLILEAPLKFSRTTDCVSSFTFGENLYCLVAHLSILFIQLSLSRGLPTATGEPSLWFTPSFHHSEEINRSSYPPTYVISFLWV